MTDGADLDPDWLGRVRGRSAQAARDPLAVRVHPHPQAGAGRRRIPRLRHHGGLPALVRGQPAGVARIWPRSATARLRRSGTRCATTACATCSSGSPGAILHGYPDTTQDADLYVEKRRENGAALVAAFAEPRVHDPGTSRRRESSPARISWQLKDGPFDIDLVFAPDGIERFADAFDRRVEIEGFPVCSMDDIIASKASANRVKDRESLPRLRAFREYLRQRR